MAASPRVPLQSFSPPSSILYTPSRKRRAASPNRPDLSSPLGANSTHKIKRQRPNLANGFQSLSISTDLLQNDLQTSDNMPPSPNDPLQTDEGIGLTHHVDSDDVKVEVLPERFPDRPDLHHHHHSNTHHWSIPNRAGPSSSSSTSPTSSTEDNYDSDVTYTHPSRRHRRFAGIAQQADEIVQPDQPPIQRGDDVSVEDITAHKGRRRREDLDEPFRAKRARKGPDIDIDMSNSDNLDNIDMDSSGGGMKRRTNWHEPEKDRIVITSLSDSSSSVGSSRSPSPEPHESQERLLSQPGMQGFTLSPSLLTHLLKSQRHHLRDNLNMTQAENSLVLYRPLGIPPGEFQESIVQAWQPGEGYADSGRFEIVDDDENLEASQAPPVDDDGDVQME
ncbi:uncharacterized protein I206_106111 [Kwoniella pini CBS 10737]|uniref:Uncharacterized protein n=1 Tax=Kwoniella pini CBS 10737 TaxID=1296096 RepID=A0A1B9I124_9TREE|nr:uncharacterized protein I206_04934 [Kwoniella pini CBS 10737]OCF49246.1 hypothetical protein I206_04934 [Kwoniella pini CBS 10737]